MVTAVEALERLKEGNQRFASGKPIRNQDVLQCAKHAQGQNPFATIIGCSDSRVPVEMIFDQGMGDLFVIRVAGNIVAPSIVGSVEFAVDYFDCPLIIVLGHSHCGAIKSTIEVLQNPRAKPTSNLMSIVKRIYPAVQPLYLTELKEDIEKLWHHGVRANVAASVSQLRHSTEMLEGMVERGEIQIVGAEYIIETGEVVFFDY